MLHNIFKLYPAWTCITWIVLLGLMAAIEWLGLKRWHGAIPLTWLIRDSVPRWALWMILGWLLYHFGVETNTNQPPQ